MHQLRLEQHHETQSSYRFERDTPLASETLSRQGLGPATAHTGMTWQGFRPSDDACVYSYNIPGNLFVRRALLLMADLAQQVFDDDLLADAAFGLSAEIAAGVARHGIINHPIYGRIYAYEVDGLGGELLMDDANMPSLLSLPLTGGRGMMHEGFDPANPAAFTRPWFSWANSMFCELVLDCCDSVSSN